MVTNTTKYIIVVFGLPGTGKTTFARKLARKMEARHLNTDVIRSLIGLRTQYAESDKQRVYHTLLDKTEEILLKGNSVVLDGTFYRKQLRDQVTKIAAQSSANIKWIQIAADEKVVKKRVGESRPYSEADYSVYQVIKRSFEPIEEAHLVLHSDREELSSMVRKGIEYIQS